MSGEHTRTHEEAHNPPFPAGAATDRKSQAKDDRTGPFGGDDGALEHERTELEEPNTATPEATESKIPSGGKPGR
jgi:hypothetical protein